MRVTKESLGGSDAYYVVRVEPNEFVTDSGKLLPYGTSLGTIRQDAKGRVKINVWMPAAYTPRGYKAAAKRALEEKAFDLFGVAALKARIW